jgi:hypothetical protein
MHVARVSNLCKGVSLGNSAKGISRTTQGIKYKHIHLANVLDFDSYNRMTIVIFGVEQKEQSKVPTKRFHPTAV